MALADGDGVLVGWVLKHDKGRLQVQDGRGRALKLADKLLIASVGRASSSDAATAAIARVSAEIEAARAGIDTAFLWECCSDLPGERTLDELGQAYFGETRMAEVQLAAFYAAVAGDNLRFKTNGLAVHVRTAEAVASLQAARERERERAAWRERAAAYLRALLGGSPGALPPPDGLADRLEGYLLHRQKDELEGILESLPGRQTARDKAFTALDRLGRLPADADRLLLVAGINPAFPPAVLAAAEAIQPAGLDGRRDFTGLPTISIDDDDTREVDDAVTVEPLPEGGTRIGIHIADASAYVALGDPLDREAAYRVSTLYLPHRSVTMLPERIGCDLASLHPGADQPTLSCLADFDAEGTLRTWELVRGRIRVTHRLNYEQADRILAGTEAHPFAASLGIADRLTAGLLAERRQGGAIVIVRPELKIRVGAEGLTVKRIDAGSASRRSISELMILFNRMAANFAEDRGIGVIYRVQDPLAEPLDIPDTYDPVRLDLVFRALRPSRVSVHPQVHAGLGLSRYVQASSPLRRYTDLVIQRQLDAWLTGAPPPYSAEELLQVIGNCLGVEQSYRALEREATRSLLLGHLRETAGDTAFAATVLASDKGGPKAELNDFLLRGQLAEANRAAAGEVILVQVAEADPESGRLLLRRCPGAQAES